MTRTFSAIRQSVFVLSLLALGMPAYAQDPAQVQRWFESGQFQQVTRAATPGAPPEVSFFAGQSYLRQNASAQAAEVYQALSQRPDSDAWHFVGLAAEQLLQGDTDGALDSARQATELNGGLTEAHYQLGLVHSRRNEWAEAAAAFDRAAETNPRYAYAHYYGGLAYYRAGRPDRMATHFEQFLQTAPAAPERTEVSMLMRSVRGR